MAWKRKETPPKKNGEKLSGPGVCQAGAGYGRKTIINEQGHDAHMKRFQASYDDPSRGLRRVRLTREESQAAYTCRRCGEWMGCAVCIDDVASLVCKNCHDWANDLSERVHGRMVGKELAREGFKIVEMVLHGKIDSEGFEKLWSEARAVMRRPDFRVREVSAAPTDFLGEGA